jgi:hypothetical protein
MISIPQKSMKLWFGDVASSKTSPSLATWPAKQERPAGGWPAKPPPTIKLVKCLYEEERERENNRSCPNNFCTPFYIPACYMSILPLSSTRPNGDV